VNQPELNVRNLSLELDKLVQRVEVQERADTVSALSANPSATVSSSQLTSLPLAEQKFTAALP
jgi:hypothetical protein